MATVGLGSGGTSVTVTGPHGTGSAPTHVSIYKRTDSSTWTEIFNSGGRSNPQVNIGNGTITISNLSGPALHSINYWYYNGSSWVQEVVDARFVVDQTPPTISTLSVSRTRGGGVTLTFSANDTNSSYWDVGSLNTAGTGISILDWNLRKGTSWATAVPVQSRANLGQAAGTNPRSYSANYASSPGTYQVLTKANDRDPNLLMSLSTSNSYNTNAATDQYSSFVVDPIPTSGPSASVYTTLSPLALQITRTDSTCDLSRYEIYCDNVLRLYTEGNAASNFYNFSTLSKTLRNRTVQFKGYQINWTGTSPATVLTSHSGSSPYRMHNMHKRKHTTIEKRASWLNGVTP